DSSSKMIDSYCLSSHASIFKGSQKGISGSSREWTHSGKNNISRSDYEDLRFSMHSMVQFSISKFETTSPSEKPRSCCAGVNFDRLRVAVSRISRFGRLVHVFDGRSGW